MLYRIDSIGMFEKCWFYWRLLGVGTFQNKWIGYVYDILLNAIVTIIYPIHLIGGLLELPKRSDLFKNLSITITCTVCSLKHFCLRWKMAQLHEIEKLLSELDQSVTSPEEEAYFNQGPKRYARYVATAYFVMYMGANVAAIAAVFLDSERRLMYPAWFPFDWHSSSALYWFALMYQFLGITIQILQNIVADALTPVVLCLMGGHVRLLAMRVARIGHDNKKSKQDHEQELKICIEDHIKLLKLFKVVEDSISLMQLILFVSSSLIICTSLCYLIFYVDNIANTLYYSVFTMAIGVELFPCYYYGSWVQEEFEGLPYAIFCSNWFDQSIHYRKSLLIFAEVTLRKLTMLGGGTVDVGLQSFFAICKMAYSLFAVVIRFK